MIGRRQPMNSWRPPSSATSEAWSDLTVAVEVICTNAGVRTGPCWVSITPARASPSRAVISKVATAPEHKRGRLRGGLALLAPCRAEGAGSGVRLCGRRSSLGCASLHLGGLAVAVPPGARDRDPARLALLRLRDANLEDAVAERRRDPVGIHAVRQRERAAEAAERALDAVPTALALLMLGLALARDRERAVLH